MGSGRSQIIRWRESLVLYKSINTLPNNYVKHLKPLKLLKSLHPSVQLYLPTLYELSKSLYPMCAYTLSVVHSQDLNAMQRGSQSDTDFSLGSIQELRGGGEGNDRMVNIVSSFLYTVEKSNSS